MYRVIASNDGNDRDNAALSSVSFTADANTIVTGSVDGRLLVWSLSESELACTKALGDPSELTAVVSLSVDATRERVGVVTMDHRLRVHALPQQKETEQDKTTTAPHEVAVGAAEVWDLVYNPVSNTFFSSTGAGEVLQLESGPTDGDEGGAQSGVVQTFESEDSSFAISTTVSPDGEFVGVSHVSGTVEVFKCGTAERVFQRTLVRGVRSLAFSTDSALLLAGSNDCLVYLYDVMGGELLRVFKRHDHQVQAVAVNPAGQYFTSADAGGRVKVWDLKTGECVHQWEFKTGVLSLAYSPDGSRLAIADTKGGLHVCMVAVPEPSPF